MKLGITGSRDITEFDFSDYFNLKDKTFLSFIHETGFSRISKLISGGARGIDSLAEEAANRISLPVERFLPDFLKYHGSMVFAAYLSRDEKIVKHADAMLVVWNGKLSSHGTLYTMDAAIEEKVPVFLVVVKQGKVVFRGIQKENIEYPKRSRWKE